jgi:NADP-dependent alcohol dehydrogenase
MTYPANAWLQDRFAESILQTLIEVAPKILADPSNYEAAANFMWSCTMALNGLIQKGVPTDWATHDWSRTYGFVQYRPCHDIGYYFPEPIP